MNGRPLVSVLIPCYNAETFVDRCLESVFAQTYQPIEVLVFDDGSTDETRELLKKQGSRIALFHSDINRGVRYARDFLFARSTGEFIHFQDADDVMVPVFIERMLRALEGGVYEAALCHTNYFSEGSGDPLREGWKVRPPREGEDGIAYLVDVGGNTSNSLYRREALARVGGYSRTVYPGEDYDLHVRLAESGCRFVPVDEPLIHYCVHESPLGYARGDLQVKALDVVGGLFRRLRDRGGRIPASLKEALAAKCWHIGRLLTESGNHAEALKAFRLSNEMDGRCVRTGSAAYRVLTRWVGIGAAERLRYFLYHRRGIVADFIIRGIQPKDSRRLAEFFAGHDDRETTRHFHPFPLTREQAHRIARGGHRDKYYAAFENNKIMGFCMLRGWDEDFSVPSLGLLIGRDSRKKGLGRRLTEFAVSEAVKLKCGKIRLTVYASNEQAVDLYRSCGFQEAQRIPVRVGGEPDEKIVMFRQLLSFA